MYAGFLIDVLSDVNEGMRMLREATELEEEALRRRALYQRGSGPSICINIVSIYISALPILCLFLNNNSL